MTSTPDGLPRSDVVIDYTAEDFTKGSEMHDLVHDNHGEGVGSWLGGMGKALRPMVVMTV